MLEVSDGVGLSVFCLSCAVQSLALSASIWAPGLSGLDLWTWGCVSMCSFAPLLAFQQSFPGSEVVFGVCICFGPIF